MQAALYLFASILLSTNAWAGTPMTETKPKVSYLDEQGQTQYVENYTLLTDETDFSDTLPGGWYVIEGEIKHDRELIFKDDVNLILADNAKLSIKEDHVFSSGKFYVFGNLNIFAQSTGKNRGQISLTDVYRGISAHNVSINGGNIVATAPYDYESNCIDADSIFINGGSVIAIADLKAKGIVIEGLVDSLKARSFHNNSIYYEESTTVSIADGLILKDEDGLMYAGTLSMRQISTLAGKTLKSYSGHALSFVTGDPSITIPAQDVSDKLPTKPTNIARKGFKFEGWFTDESYTTEFDFTKPLTQNAIAYAKWSNIKKIPYIDENGKTKEISEYFYLTDSTETEYLPGGWYVVEGKVSYKNRLKFTDEANLIIVDGAKLSVESDRNTIDVGEEHNLNIYAQSTGKNRGDFHAVCLDSFIEINYGTIQGSNLSINGVKFTAKDIRADKISVHSADFTASKIFLTEFFINEGSVVKIANSYVDEIFVNGKVDRFKVDNYNAEDDINYSVTLHIADGLILQDEDGNAYTGILKNEQVPALNGKTLKAFADSTTTIEKKALPMAGNLEISYANDQLSINGSKGSEIKVAVFDMMGNLAELSRGSGSGMTVPLTHLNRGPYVVRVSAGRTMRTLRILVK